MEKLPMNIMQCEYQSLREALAGYVKTGTPLIGYDGNAMKPAGLADDIGIYYFIPKIANALGISIDQSISVFFTSVIYISLFLGIIGVFLYFKRWPIKLLGVIELILLAYRSSLGGAIHTILSSVPIAIVPLFLYFTRCRKLSLALSIFLLWAGIAIGTANQLRSHSGTGVLIFMIIILCFYLQISWKQKIVLVILTVATTLAPMVYFGELLDRRDAYLRKNLPGYVQVPRNHVFWHSIYIGFGFLNNEYGIRYKDVVAIDKVRSISPTASYASHEYEKILRNEVTLLLRKHPLFAATTIFAKIGVVILFFLIFGNFGVIAAVLNRRKWEIEIAFLCTLVFNSLHGLLVIPTIYYLWGFNCFATLYGLVSIDQSIEHRSWLRLRTLLRGKRVDSLCVE
jgi:hypothetical protein